MKKTTIITTSLIVMLTSILVYCKKDDKLGNSEIKKTGNHSANRTIADVEVPEDANEEMIRIFKDVQSPDYEVAIIDNPNYGQFSSTAPGYDILLGGKTNPADKISVELDGTSYSPSADGQWLRQNIVFKDYIGKTVNVKIKSDNNLIVEGNIYVPKAHLASKLGTSNSLNINRTGNTITWISDPNNSTGKVILYYQLFDGSGGIITSDATMIDDNAGSFCIDNIISGSNTKSIIFSLITGNTLSCIINTKKLLFYINTRDHHEYFIN